MKMNRSHLLLMISILVWSCNAREKDKPEKTSFEQNATNENKKEQLDEKSTGGEKADSSLKKVDPKRASLEALLQDPFDLKFYKTKKGGANGGTFRPQTYDIKPDTVGHYYRYFWFHKLRGRFGHESESVDATIVYSYIYGEKIGTYEKVEEQLLGIRSRITDEDMGKLNLIGKDASFLLERYDLERSGDYLFGAIDGDVLILHLSKSSVDWFFYRRTNLTIKNFEDIPPYLLEYRRAL